MKRQPKIAAPYVEFLEQRLYMTVVTPTTLATVSLPGAGSSWPIFNGPITPSPVFVDIDGDGTQELVTTGGDNELHAYRFVNGTAQLVMSYVQTVSPDYIQSTPVFANGAVFVGTHAGLVYGWNLATGQVLPGWPQSTRPPAAQAGQSDPVLTAVTVADINGDGVPEIITSGILHELDVFSFTGNLLWQFNNDDTVLSSPVVGDVNGDGHIDIVDGGDSSPSQFYWQGGRINVLAVSGRREAVYQTDEVVWSSPVLADMNGDGILDIVAGTGYFYPENQTAPFPGNKVYAIDGNGNNLPGWPFVTDPSSTDGRVQSSPAVGDLNGDGALDVVVGTGGGEVIAIGNNGQALWRKTLTADVDIWSSPVIADINGDGQPDVVIGQGSTLYGLDGATGNIIWVSDTPGFFNYNAPAIGHFKGDSSWQLAVVDNAVNGSLQPLAPSQLKIYDLPSSSVNPSWRGFRQDYTNSAVIHNTAASENLVANLYRYDLLREGAPGEIAFWAPIFEKAPVLQDAIQGIVGSTEARSDNIDNWYEVYLGRHAEPAGLQSWLNTLAAGASYGAAQIGFASSDEAFTYRGGGTNLGWVRYLYQTLLNRQPSSDEEHIWVTPLDAGTVTRAQVAQGFLLSRERTENTVKMWYADYQPGSISVPSSAVLEAAAGDLRTQARTDEQVLGNILGSNGNYIETHPQGSWIVGLYNDALGRNPTTQEATNWILQFENGATLASVASAVLGTDEYKARLVSTWYTNYLGRPVQAGESSTWVAALDNGTSQAAIIKTLLGTDEYFARAGGTTQGFINQVYVDLLGRAPSTAEMNQWVSVSGSQNIRATLPQLILIGAPDEYNRHLVDNIYLWYLRRYTNTPADGSRLIAAGTAFGDVGNENYLNAGGDPTAVRIAIVSTGEYQSLQNTNAVWHGSRWLDNTAFTGVFA